MGADDNHGDLVRSWLENLTIEQMRSYGGRGRHLAKTGDAELRLAWVDAMNLWAADLATDTTHKAREDLQAEMLLRGYQPPFELVKGALDTLQDRTNARTFVLRRDPVQLAQAERCLTEHLDAFRESIERRPKN